MVDRLRSLLRPSELPKVVLSGICIHFDSALKEDTLSSGDVDRNGNLQPVGASEPLQAVLVVASHRNEAAVSEEGR